MLNQNYEFTARERATELLREAEQHRMVLLAEANKNAGISPTFFILASRAIKRTGSAFNSSKSESLAAPIHTAISDAG